ncbi:hypothetical protein FNV43_RR00430 [Rhamnella rubrinervis]|uniref:Uncharacterized protein n=1 Tax=Rhamnella rubrinervis TaxID=2594499 RepID=A0A8K0HQK7_9ROSA|nr:hypothetical protein FNV43_RR00430 [Rhamnella rubrinervis]
MHPLFANVVMSSVSKKPRGRPKKLAQSNAGVGPFMTTLMTIRAAKGRQRGRPPKVKPPLTKNVCIGALIFVRLYNLIESARTNCMENADENHVHMEKDKPESNLCEKNMEEKIDYIVQTLECLQNSVETLNAKIESLTKENDELSKELEAALATVEALEQLDWCVLVEFFVAMI